MSVLSLKQILCPLLHSVSHRDRERGRGREKDTERGREREEERRRERERDREGERQRGKLLPHQNSTMHIDDT